MANAVYRAGKAQRQDEYDTAVNLVFGTMQAVEDRLRFRQFLVTSHLTEPDIRLFATLVRFDTVYATHFRCTRYRLVDFPNLTRFTRDIYQNPLVRKTVDFDEIRRGYYLNDGTHNPHGIVAEQPFLGWLD
ncbi:glutathione S-transferase C-terminal domain-containing protein [uncultured Ruegeria sp.]|uniref:glutathione S-transferase C-terminal domain-containing protein n=1 Tax=uncultured Ruegeria sp. TaxID=259304 RepID=UPI00261881E6|nr:glutathione S-transferase C-terminal domain-containing protein [uncultured Ruegeria sp.]